MDLKHYKIIAEAEHKAKTLVHELASQFGDDPKALLMALARAASQLKAEIESMLPPKEGEEAKADDKAAPPANKPPVLNTGDLNRQQRRSIAAQTGEKIPSSKGGSPEPKADAPADPAANTPPAGETTKPKPRSKK